MLNDDDKDKNFEGQEESEYHFSDDEVNYEVEPEPTKPAAPEEGPKVSFLNKLSQSKRMLISGAVFILLIFVVYKMVTPTVTTPSTDITIATAQRPPAMATPAAPLAPSAPAPTTQMPTPTAQGPGDQMLPGVALQQPPSTTAPGVVPPGAAAFGPQTAQAPTPPPGGALPPPPGGALQPPGAALPPPPGGALQPPGGPLPPPAPAQALAETAPTTVPAPGSGIQPTSPITPTPSAPPVIQAAQAPPVPTPGAAAPQAPSTGLTSQAPQAPITQAASGAMAEMGRVLNQGAEILKTPIPPPGGMKEAPTTAAAPAKVTGPITTDREKRAEAAQAGMISMPAIIPVQAPIPTTVATVSVPTLPAERPTQPAKLIEPGAIQAQLQTPMPEKAQTELVSLQIKSEKLMTELQADYARKLNDFAAQNRALQDQMQSLNARVAGMETQLSQLLQALMRPQAAVSKEHEVVETAVVEQRISYNVQAIIPGRAWLKSGTGETVTVAEGDVVRDLGRITKIDPYDGFVEINTGKKVIALSYGSGG